MDYVEYEKRGGGVGGDKGGGGGDERVRGDKGVSEWRGEDSNR